MNPKYLIKFYSEKCYVEKLVNNGEVFMQSASVFQNIERAKGEKGQGDIRDSIVFDCMYVGNNFPIYCLYSVYDSDMVMSAKNRGIKIAKNAINDFCSSLTDGYFALVPYNGFVERLNKAISDTGFAASHGKVLYGKKSVDVEKGILCGKYDGSFIKDSILKYQQEYRIKIYRDLEKEGYPLTDIQKRSLPDKVLNSGIQNMKYKSYTLEIGCIDDVASKHSCKELMEYESDNGYYLLELGEPDV